LRLEKSILDIKIKGLKKVKKKPLPPPPAPVIEEPIADQVLPPPKKASCCKQFCAWLLMLFDGFEAFQCDESKLARLRGNKPTCRDKLKSLKQMALALFMFISMMAVMMVEMMKIRTVKS
jgi:hypothetical protein